MSNHPVQQACLIGDICGTTETISNQCIECIEEKMLVRSRQRIRRAIVRQRLLGWIGEIRCLFALHNLRNGERSAAGGSEFQMDALPLISAQIVGDPLKTLVGVEATNELGVQRAGNHDMGADARKNETAAFNEIKYLAGGQWKRRRVERSSGADDAAQRPRIVLSTGRCL